MKIVADLSVTSAPMRAKHGWHPGWLFRGGAQGAWFNSSDLTSLWQDTARTVPAAVGQPVARMDDLSGNGNHMAQATAAKRPTYQSDGVLHWLEFDGVDDGMFAVTPASVWAWAHQQGGVTFGVAAQVSAPTVGTEFLLGTMTGDSSSNIGVSMKSDNTGALGYPNAARITIARGVAGVLAAAPFTNSGADTTKIWTLVTDVSGVTLTGRSFTMPQNWLNLPTATGNPSLTLYLGGVGSGWLHGRIYGAVVINRALNAADEVRLRQWFAARAGVGD